MIIFISRLDDTICRLRQGLSWWSWYLICMGERQDGVGNEVRAKKAAGCGGLEYTALHIPFDPDSIEHRRQYSIHQAHSCFQHANSSVCSIHFSSRGASIAEVRRYGSQVSHSVSQPHSTPPTSTIIHYLHRVTPVILHTLIELTPRSASPQR